jgi:hypothetical protein
MKYRIGPSPWRVGTIIRQVIFYTGSIGMTSAAGDPQIILPGEAGLHSSRFGRGNDIGSVTWARPFLAGTYEPFHNEGWLLSHRIAQIMMILPAARRAGLNDSRRVGLNDNRRSS